MIKQRTTMNLRVHPVAGDQRGFTMVEMVVYLLIFTLFMGGFVWYFTWARTVQKGANRLDVLHQLRMSSFQVSEEISYGSQIIFPPIDADRIYHQMSFKNNANEIVVLAVNELGQLMMYNLMKKSRGQPYAKVLTDNTIRFEVKRPGNHYLEYELTIKDEKGKEFHLANSARLRNVLK